MLNFFERGFLATVGMLSLSREKTQEVVDEMVQRGELNRDEGKQLVDKMVRRGQEEQDRLRNLVRQEVENAMRELNLANRKDIEAINQKLDELAQKLEKA